MTKEQVLNDIQALIGDINGCTHRAIAAAINRDMEERIETLKESQRLLVAAHQELSFLYDYIKEGGKDE